MTADPAVTVVVPLFSTGPYIRPLLDCLDRQAPPDGGFEVLLLDDGSTDHTGSLIARWASRRPWAHAEVLPHSGWPSHPRNVGIDRARGEFVFFVDHDDWLADDALARMTAFARRHGSDVVVGAMHGLGRRVPVRLFGRTVADARPPATPLPDSMTVHAMFRTSFLREAGLRFDESLRRLEDHLFMAAAYTTARRVSVLADAPVYVHSAREDDQNAGHRPYDPREYYAALGRAIEVVVNAAVAPAERDAYLARWVRLEMIGRLRSEAVRSLPPERRDAFFVEVRSLLRRVPDSALAQLSPGHRDHAAAIVSLAPEAYWSREDAHPGPGGSDRPAVRARRWLVEALSRQGAWVQRRAVRWARNRAALARAAGALGAVVCGVAAAAAVAAPAVSIALTAVAAALTAWLAVRSLSPWPTAGRQLLALSPAVIASIAGADTRAGLATAAAVVLVGAGVAADRAWRRHDVTAYPARRGGAFARLGGIGLLACALSAVVTGTVAFAVLR